MALFFEIVAMLCLFPLDCQYYQIECALAEAAIGSPTVIDSDDVPLYGHPGDRSWQRLYSTPYGFWGTQPFQIGNSVAVIDGMGYLSILSCDMMDEIWSERVPSIPGYQPQAIDSERLLLLNESGEPIIFNVSTGEHSIIHAAKDTLASLVSNLQTHKVILGFSDGFVSIADNVGNVQESINLGLDLAWVSPIQDSDMILATDFGGLVIIVENDTILFAATPSSGYSQGGYSTGLEVRSFFCNADASNGHFTLLPSMLGTIYVLEHHPSSFSMRCLGRYSKMPVGSANTLYYVSESGCLVQFVNGTVSARLPLEVEHEFDIASDTKGGVFVVGSASVDHVAPSKTGGLSIRSVGSAFPSTLDSRPVYLKGWIMACAEDGTCYGMRYP